MTEVWRILPLQVVKRSFSNDLKPNLQIISAVLIFSALQALCVFAGSHYDNTLVLPGVGKGFFEHYGVWAILLTDPVLVISAGYGYCLFKKTVMGLPIKNDHLEDVENLCQKHFDFLEAYGPSIYIYILLVVVGVMSWIVNLFQTTNPVEIYGNDVFDSSSYTLGYFANKINLFTSWVIVYPAVGFMFLSMSFSTYLILRRLEKEKILELSAFHPDGSYGLRDLGKLNIALLWPYVIAFSVTFCLGITHEITYSTLVFPIGMLAALCLCVSYITIQPTLAHVDRVRESTYLHLKAQFRQYASANRPGKLQYLSEYILYSLVDGSPYSKSAKLALNAMRFSPAVLTIGRLIAG